MEPLVEHELELAGYRTRALELEGDGPPLLLLHGFADSADTWRIVLDRLARLGHRALALDMPGYGAASPLHPGLVLPQLDGFARAAVEHVGDDGAVVAGNSLGGCVALRLAQQEDLRLAGVVPVAPAGLAMARWFALIERDFLTRTLLDSPVPIPGPVVRRVVSDIYKRLVFRHPDSVDPLVARTFSSHLGSRAVAARVMASGRRVLAELRDPFDLERIACPVLLVWGTHDLLVFQAGAERVLDAVAESRLETIDDCGHCPQIECADRFTELLLEFQATPAEAG